MKLPWRRRRKDLERELQEELDAHFAIDTQQRVGTGCEPVRNFERQSSQKRASICPNIRDQQLQSFN